MTRRGFQGIRLNFRIWWFRIELLPRPRIILDPRKTFNPLK